jgi:hypothetical protein
VITVDVLGSDCLTDRAEGLPNPEAYRPAAGIAADRGVNESGDEFLGIRTSWQSRKAGAVFRLCRLFRALEARSRQ